MPVVNRMQVDGGTMEAHAKSEDGEHKGAADHAPAIECRGGRSHAANLSKAAKSTLRRGSKRSRLLVNTPR